MGKRSWWERGTGEEGLNSDVSAVRCAPLLASHSAIPQLLQGAWHH